MSPKSREGAEPVEEVPIKDLGVEQAGRSAMQLVVTPFAVAKAVGLVQGAMPGMPEAAILAFDAQVHGDLADIVEQGAVGDAGGPGIGLCRLVFRGGARGQQVGLAQFQAVGNQFQTVIEHAAVVGVMMGLAGRELLDPLGVALDRVQVELLELGMGQRGEFPDACQQLLSMGGLEQVMGRLHGRVAFRERFRRRGSLLGFDAK